MNAFVDQRLFLTETKNKGFGVFTKEEIPINTIIEISPVLKIKMNDLKNEFKKINIWCYNWNKRNVGLSNGFGPLYNHNWNPNVIMTYTKNQYFCFKTIRKINKNEELFISYGGTWWKEKNIPEPKVEFNQNKIHKYLYISNFIEIRKTKKGQHVLKAKNEIPQGTIVEIARCLYFPFKKLRSKNILNKYLYNKKRKNKIFSFGYSNLYKTNENNFNIKCFTKNKKLHFETTRKIKKGELLKIKSKNL